MANTTEPPNPNPPDLDDPIDVPPLDMDFLNSDLGFMDDLDFDFDIDISFDDLTFPVDGSDLFPSPDSPEKLDRSFNDVSGGLNSPSPESGDEKGASQESGGCSSVVGGFLNSPSPESGVMSASASGSTSPVSDCNVQSVIVDVVDQEVKVEEESAKGALKRKKEEENSSNPRKFRKSVSISATGSPSDGAAPEEDKKKARLMRNRESAQLSRQRKKHYVEELEDKVRSMHTVITDLNNRISYIMAENVTLRQQLSGGSVPPPPQPGVYPPPGMPPMGYPWIPYPMNPQGSQVPLIPIPRLKPRQPTSASKTKKSDGKKSESKTKKVASVTFLGLLFFLFLFGGLVPLVNNVRYGGKMENGYSGFGYSSGGLHGHPKERILTVNNHLNKSHPSVEGYHSVASDLRECGADRINCRRVWVEGTESNVKLGKQGSQPLPNSNGSGCGGNSSESLAASLYVPRNDKLVKIDGNLIIHSVLASERAMASRVPSEIKSDKAGESLTNESPQTSLAIAGNLAAAFSFPNDERHAERHYRSPSVRPKALNAGSRDNYKEAPRSTATDGSLQKWFLEGLAGPILSSGMCTEVFQFDVSPSANPGGIVPAPSTVNISSTNDTEPVHPSKRNRRILNHVPIPLAGSEFNHTADHAGIPTQNGDFQNKNLSSMVVSVLVDPREAGDIEVDGGISPKSLSRIFVVVLIDSVKYVTYSCMLPFKGSNTHLVTT